MVAIAWYGWLYLITAQILNGIVLKESYCAVRISIPGSIAIGCRIVSYFYKEFNHTCWCYIVLLVTLY